MKRIENERDSVKKCFHLKNNFQMLFNREIKHTRGFFIPAKLNRFSFARHCTVQVVRGSSGTLLARIPRKYWTSNEAV